MPLFKRKKESDDNLDKSKEDRATERQLKKDEKTADKEEKVDSRRDYRLEKIQLLTEKASAVAKKRKWLVFLLGLGLVIYFVVSSGGAGGMGGIIEKVKGFF